MTSRRRTGQDLLSGRTPGPRLSRNTSEKSHAPSAPKPDYAQIAADQYGEMVSLWDELPKLLFDNVGDHAPDALVRGLVVREYAIVDCQLGSVLFLYFMGYAQKQYASAVRSGRFLEFYELVESIPIVRKLSLLKSVVAIPSEIGNIIEKVNDVRNAVAHVALASVSTRREFRYGKARLHTLPAMRAFFHDVRQVHDYFDQLKTAVWEGKVQFRAADCGLSMMDQLRALFPSSLSATNPAGKPQTHR